MKASKISILLQFLSLLLLLCSLSQAIAQEQAPGNLQTPTSYSREALSPLFSDVNLKADDLRFIDPTSPILGKNWSTAIRSDPRSVPEIFKAIQEQYPEWKNDIYQSVVAYLSTVTPGLEKFCNTPKADRQIPDDKSFTQVENAAIPVEVLGPMHGTYREQIKAIKMRYAQSANSPLSENTKLDLAVEAQRSAIQFIKLRLSCPVIKNLEHLESLMKKLSFGLLTGDIDIHHKISSPETSYPRIQFTINGFTEYVYGELFKFSTSELEALLDETVSAETAWLDLAKEGRTGLRFISFVEEALLQKGFKAREILLALAYSTRNMPSLDLQYALSPEKALLLEMYFWKLHPIRDQLQSKFSPELYPNKVMKQDPGLYHYLTSALMACDIRLSGYSRFNARLITYLDSLAYKVNKLAGEVKGKKKAKELHGIKGIFKIAKKQGFHAGILSGRFGGKHGLDFCETHTPREEWTLNQITNTADFTESGLLNWEESLDVALLPQD